MRPAHIAPGIALSAVLADAGGAHGLAAWLVLLALPVAAAAAFLAISDALAGTAHRLPAVTGSLALALLVLGSAVRQAAPRGHVPALAVSTIVVALACYALPAAVWLLSEPVRSVRTAAPRPRASRA
ncbi:MAG: hypothetical protein KGL94_05310 [Acidobacteriota bacterium]|nr:hypothetical protein [Acidobacteriota bacterium]